MDLQVLTTQQRQRIRESLRATCFDLKLPTGHEPQTRP